METIINTQEEITLQEQDMLKVQPKTIEHIIMSKCSKENTGQETCILFMSNNFRHLDY